MIRWPKYLAYLSLAYGLPLTAAVELQDKPVFDVRLEGPLSSVTSVVGTPVRAVVASPALLNGNIYLRVGARITGKVTRRNRVGFGLRHERATLEVLFTEMEDSDSRTFPLRASLISVDNAREEVNQRGQIKGILAADSLPTYIFGVWYRPSFVLPHRALLGLTGASGMTWARLAPSPIGAAAFLGLRYALVPWPNPEIYVPTGTELRLRLESIDENAPMSTALDALPIDEDLGLSLGAREFQITKAGGEAPADIVNLAFIGTRAQLVTAFETAGWQSADILNQRSFRDGYHAFTTAQGYATAPVSDLRYQGQTPDLVFQKSFNTIAKRHHIRIWAAGEWQDQALWLGAASHDIGVDFDSSKLIFTHRIDQRLDFERTKVINDLAYVGCLDAVSYVDRTVLASRIMRKRDIQTDGRLAVSFVGHCLSPTLGRLEQLTEDSKPRLLYRLSQRTILETRNYLLRRNAYYQFCRFVQRTRIFTRRTRTTPLLDNPPLHDNIPLARLSTSRSVIPVQSTVALEETNGAGFTENLP